MFGYVIANPALLDEAQQQRYRACYCGLCRTLRAEYGAASRLALNYDMTFLLLLLSSLYEPPEQAGSARCPAHPLRRQDYFCTSWASYCAGLTAALAYYNCMDDWQDEGSLPRLAEARLFRRAAGKAAARYPRQAAAVSGCIAALSRLEKAGAPDPDGAANCFGRLMGELFVPDEDDRWADLLRTVGEGLGRFVYTLDAVLDLPEDLRRGRYNPLSDRAARPLSDFQPALTMLIAECADAFERLPLVQDAALLRNILYSGVWLRYAQALDKQTTHKEAKA